MVRKGTPDSCLSVTELVALINQVFDQFFPVLRFQGEIQQITVAQSGHIYLTIKDEQAQMPAVMWRSTAKLLRFQPKVGEAVICEGRPTVYDRSGKLQIVLSRMEPLGEGVLQRRFLELKAKLEQEGLFAIERKRPLPFLPKAVGIVTSPTGAVIHDICVKVTERLPTLQLYLIPVRVQGEGAATEIARAVARFNQLNNVDLIIVARGGGSLEDLWAFNEEEVVRAIFASRLPVVSAVGHETDTTLSDLVADYRAPTPTAAAERVAPHRGELLRRIDDLTSRLWASDRWLNRRMQNLDEESSLLDRAFNMLTERLRARISNLAVGLRGLSPSVRLEGARMRVDRLQVALERALLVRRQDGERQLVALEHRLKRLPLETRFRDLAHRFGVRVDGLASAIDKRVRENAERLARGELRLEAVSPQRVLERGFCVVQSEGRAISSVSQVRVGSELLVTVSDGRIRSQVEGVEEG